MFFRMPLTAAAEVSGQCEDVRYGPCGFHIHHAAALGVHVAIHHVDDNKGVRSTWLPDAGANHFRSHPGGIMNLSPVFKRFNGSHHFVLSGLGG